MSLVIVESGNFIIYEGTATELATVLKGKSRDQIKGFATKDGAGTYGLIIAL